ncbi:MAG: NTP transferase domain-containing protein [Patescibacteria group bacterium]
MNTRIIILATGKGKRMQSDSPKVLVSLGGRPLISYLVEAVESSGVDQKTILVVGWGAHEVQ